MHGLLKHAFHISHLLNAYSGQTKLKNHAPLMADTSHVAFHCILCWKKAKSFPHMTLHALHCTNAQSVKATIKDDTPRIALHQCMLRWKKKERPFRWPWVQARGQPDSSQITCFLDAARTYESSWQSLLQSIRAQRHIRCCIKTTRNPCDDSTHFPLNKTTIQVIPRLTRWVLVAHSQRVDRFLGSCM